MPIRRSSRLDRLPPYLFAEVERKRRELVAQGKDVVNLGIGDPDQPAPALLQEAVKAALAEPLIHQYSPTEGTAEFRAAVARFHKRRHGVTLDPAKEVLLAIGSKEIIAHLPLAFTEPGDVVLIPEPGYPPYRSGTLFALAEPHILPLAEERGFLPDLGAIPESVAKRAKVLFLNYPNNPTGALAPDAFWKDAIAFCRKHGILLVSDNAYAEMYYEKRARSILEFEGAREVAIEFHSLSKTFNATGWRIAWGIGNAEALEHLRNLKTNLDSGQFMVLQKAAARALDEGDATTDAIRAMYRKRRDLLCDGLTKAGWKVPRPEATFYVWFKPPAAVDAMTFCTRVLEQAHVVLTPGVGFGQAGAPYVRISLTTSEDRLLEAVKRLTQIKF